MELLLQGRMITTNPNVKNHSKPLETLQRHLHNSVKNRSRPKKPRHHHILYLPPRDAQRVGAAAFPQNGFGEAFLQETWGSGLLGKNKKMWHILIKCNMTLGKLWPAGLKRCYTTDLGTLFLYQSGLLSVFSDWVFETQVLGSWRLGSNTKLKL